jgi:uncharacterized protein (TIGR02145 family)
MKHILFILLYCAAFALNTFCQAIKEVKIGDQVWMGANLNVDKFQNGDPIPQAKTKNEWIKASKDKKPAWCYYQNNAQNGMTYGKLYNWYAVNDPRGLAPKGWHIPSKSEWDELISFLNKDVKDVNEALKTKTGWKQYESGGNETGEQCGYCNGTGQHYSSISYTYKTCAACGGTGGDRRYVKKRILSGNGTNTSGFAAKPGSNRFDDGDFNNNIGLVAVWWLASKTELDETNTEYIYIDNNYYKPQFNKYGKGFGSSIRLVKDDPKKIERERIALEEKKKKELLEIQLKEERIKQEQEQEKLRILEAEKKEQERKLQDKVQDSLRKIREKISDSINIGYAQTADDIINKHIEAIGGKDNWKKVTSMVMTGTMSLQGTEIQLKRSVSHNTGSRTDITLMGMTGYQILTNAEGWSYMPFQGQATVEAMTPDQVKDQQDELDVHGALIDYAAKGHSTKYIGKEDVEGTECFKVQLTMKGGKSQTYFFDPATYYIVKVSSVMKANGQENEIATTFSNYQKHESGIVLPMSTIFPLGPGMSTDLTFSKIEVNTKLDASVFKPAK